MVRETEHVPRAGDPVVLINGEQSVITANFGRDPFSRRVLWSVETEDGTVRSVRLTPGEPLLWVEVGPGRSGRERAEDRQRDFPLLNGHLLTGRIFAEGDEYVGIAADGTEVIVGNVSAPQHVESYLREHPTPRDW